MAGPSSYGVMLSLDGCWESIDGHVYNFCGKPSFVEKCIAINNNNKKKNIYCSFTIHQVLF
jgi:hypothetical protein